MPYRQDIFVSATMQDLRSYRRTAIDTVHEMGHHAIAMEHYGAVDRDAVEKCLADVRKCRVFISIIAWRYGYIPVGFEKSLTEMEYQEAVREEIPRFVFLLDENTPWVPALIDRDRTRIETFRDDLEAARIVGYFNSPDSLGKGILAALAREFLDSNGDEHSLDSNSGQFLHRVMQLVTSCRKYFQNWIDSPTETNRSIFSRCADELGAYLLERQLLAPSESLYEQVHLYKREAERIAMFIAMLPEEKASWRTTDREVCENALETLSRKNSQLRKLLRTALASEE